MVFRAIWQNTHSYMFLRRGGRQQRLLAGQIKSKFMNLLEFFVIQKKQICLIHASLNLNLSVAYDSYDGLWLQRLTNKMPCTLRANQIQKEVTLI